MTMQASVKLVRLLRFDLALIGIGPWAELETVMTIIYREVYLPKDPRRSPLTAKSPVYGIPQSEPGILKRGRVASGQRIIR